VVVMKAVQSVVSLFWELSFKVISGGKGYFVLGLS
jgi:hypothetical protein